MRSIPPAVPNPAPSARRRQLLPPTEVQTAVEGVRAGRLPDLLSGKLARDALVLCHKECESVRTGEAVTV